MAMTHDYLDYLNEKIGISPANSEEELQAAQVIADLMAQHAVEPVIEDFDEPKMSGLAPAGLAVLCLIGMVLVGISVLPLTIIGLVLAALPAVLSLMRLFGRSPKISFGPRAQSQNVIAVHKATGPLVTKGSRTIVVCAHYDTPRENFLYTSPVAPYVTLLSRISVPCALAVGICALFQLLVFLPDVLRAILWIVGIFAALPAAIVAVGTISSRVGACTDGANDNKSGVAAMLGVLENVRPSGATPKVREAAPAVEAEPEPEPATAADAEPAPEAEAAVEVASSEETVVSVPEADEDQGLAAAPTNEMPAISGREVEGVRHGEEVLRSLGILPETCEIEYLVSPSAAATAGTTGTLGAEPAAQEDDGEADATLPTRRSRRSEESSEKGWGKTSFIPKLTNLARRASLFDLPDPSGNEVDPLATDPNARRVTVDEASRGDAEGAAAVEPLETISAPADTEPSAPAEKKNPFLSVVDSLRDKIGSLMAKAKDGGKAAEDADGDSSEDEESTWRGGAATRSGLRLVGEDEAPVADEDNEAIDQMVDDVVDQTSEQEQEWTEQDADENTGVEQAPLDAAELFENELAGEAEDVPTDEDLRDEVLSLRDDALVAHDIWFVALGSSVYDHAGMRAFLANHRSEIRGCFVINLDSVGAGRLAVLKNEGLEETRRADRRISRMLNNAAADLHIELESVRHDWADTDATPAMRSSLRSATIMGLDASDLPALSGTPDDVAENVDGVQASQVAALVTEVIRRS